MQAARAVFALRGYTTATLDEIAERAEFAKGTLYNYFQSKEDIFQHILEDLLRTLTRIAEEAMAEGGTTREKFQRYAVRMIQYFKDEEDFLKIVVRELNRMLLEGMQTGIQHAHQRIYRTTAALATALREDPAIHTFPGFPVEEMAHMFSEMIHVRAMKCTIDAKSLRAMDPDQEARFVTELFFDGASARP
jgi:TetR/AcrR family transcriptional regulator, repressor of fatR-cypB operon